MDSSHDCTGLRVAPVAANPVELELGEAEHDPQHKPAGVGRQIEAVSDRYERPAGGADAFDELQAIDQRPAEPVEFRDDDAVAIAAFDSFDRLEQQGPVASSTGFVELFEDLEALVPVSSDPSVDPLTLNRGADEGVAAAAADLANADVPVKTHTCQRYGTRPCTHRTTRRTLADDLAAAGVVA